MKRLLLAGAALVALASTSHAVVIRHDRTQADYTTLAAQTQFSSVGFVGHCTGVLIAPQWVLTAAHCGGASTFTLSSGTYTINQTVTHPGWTGNLYHGNDIALWHLTTPVVGITPATVFDGTIAGLPFSEIGQKSYSVGFGFTGDGLTGQNGSGLGTKRAMENNIDALATVIPTFTPAGGASYLIGDFDKPGDPTFSLLGATTPENLEGMIAPGDSGGGTFMEVGGAYYLIGIHSFLDGIDIPGGDGTDNASYKDVFGVTRVANYSSWISSTISAPEPGTLALLALGLSAVRLRRRK